MERLLIVTFTLALSLLGSWSASAEPAEAPIPEPVAAPAGSEAELTEIAPSDADAESAVPADQESQDTQSKGLSEASCETLSSEAEGRQNAGCTFTCSHPIMCPWLPGLPGARCVNGCCVYG